MTPGRAVWMVIAVIVFVYNLFAREGYTLSEEVDRWLERNPAVVRLIVFLIARHLTNDIPPRVDPVGLLFMVARIVVRRALTRPIRLRAVSTELERIDAAHAGDVSA